MEYSLPAWLGALAGTCCGSHLRAGDPRRRAQFSRASRSADLEQRTAFEEKFPSAPADPRVDIAIMATVGYWIGHATRFEILSGSKRFLT